MDTNSAVVDRGTLVVEPTKQEKAKTRAKTHPKPDKNGNPVKAKTTVTAAPTVTKKGVKKISESLTPTELKAQIKELLKDLKDSTDAEEKKTIRRKLRIRGHFGGLGDDKE